MRCLPVLLMGLVFAAPPLEQVNRAVRQVLADERIQSDYPGGEGAEAEAPEEGPQTESSQLDPLDAPAATPFATVLMWALIGVGVLLVLAWLVQNLGGLARDVDLGAGSEAAASGRTAPPVSLGNAEGLAVAGRFDEAVHALLLLAMSSLQGGHDLTGSMTSREVLREARLPAPAQEGVRGLVEAVEISLFGGRPLGEADYRRSVEHYRQFVSAQTQGRA